MEEMTCERRESVDSVESVEMRKSVLCRSLLSEDTRRIAMMGRQSTHALVVRCRSISMAFTTISCHSEIDVLVLLGPQARLRVAAKHLMQQNAGCVVASRKSRFQVSIDLASHREPGKDGCWRGSVTTVVVELPTVGVHRVRYKKVLGGRESYRV